MSSDESDSDDLLSGVPTFARRSNRTTINKTKKQEEKRKNFLEELTKCADERVEEELRIEAIIRADNDATAETHNSSRLLLKEEFTAEGDDKENHINDRENTKKVAGVVTKADVAGDIDWERLELEKERCSASARSKRRQDMIDAIDGIQSSPMGTQKNFPEFSKRGKGIFDDNDDYIERRNKKIASANAKKAGALPKLGCRCVFNDLGTVQNIQKENSSFPFHELFDAFSSEEEAVNCLQPTLITLLDEMRSLDRQGRQEKIGLKNLLEGIQKAIESELLPEYVSLRRIATKSKELNVLVPVDIQKWLWRVICSPAHILGADFVHGAADTMINIINATSSPLPLCTGDGTLQNMALVDYLKVLSIDYFGLQMKSEGVNQEKLQEKEINCSDLPALKPARSATLDRILKVWKKAFENDNVSLAKSGETNNTPCDDISQIIVICAKASLDPSFYMGTTILNTQKSIIYASIRKVFMFFHQSRDTAPKEEEKETYEKCTAEQDAFFRWTNRTASSVISQVTGLGRGLDGSSDNDDVAGYLPLCLAVQLMSLGPTNDVHDEKERIALAQFEAALVQEALRNLFGYAVEEWENRALDLIVERCEISQNDTNEHLRQRYLSTSFRQCPVRWQAVSTAELSLLLADEMKTSIIQNGPLFYSIVRIVKSCIDVATTLFVLCEPNEDQSFCRFLNDASQHCARLRGKSASAINNDHFRRVKELLASCEVQCKRTKDAVWERSKFDPDTPVKEAKQTTLERSWMGQDS